MIAMTKLLEIKYTVRGTLILEVPDNFNPKTIDSAYIANNLGIEFDYDSIDFRIVEEKK